jgi:E3 ubiquitin-protein ligase DOA10
LLDALVALAFGFAFYVISPMLGIIVGVSLFLLLAMTTHVLYDFCKSTYFTLMYIELHPELKKKDALKQK